ncbi:MULTISPECIES: FAD-dependent oxidoreductase [unclassified Bosea (in: a-proteobacteria)]|uniref:NAD(P)/FAD-dependent oxidoreductase n=1 Tax=unclassified Bosea (in: a-proteobacteria) TaxID=2653178 RepID=UPI000F755AAA|nr:MULTISPECIES: FAD-dependent oxidoreductase [unclassified Bosea (in: a-proteobacteria)]AZO79131.1 FAD-dependent oxidoreductase [Bosea sp. Tri-49]RXT27474.1 FAD-dependent oxidoreductase [Bosea sp. Tri-39]RXT35821.1 FAD-dependent oxidoreductase [Bosea sp. Tri-54]
MTTNANRNEGDVVVIGGGVVGAAVALGLARSGARVIVLDEGDVAFRASRGNFALVWVQSKGLGMPEYALWTRRSAEDWHGLAAILRDEAGIDVVHSQPGGFVPCLSEAELEKRTTAMRRLHNLPGLADFPYEVLGRAETKRRLPDIGKDVVGALYSPLDGHVNSLKLFRALREASARHGVDYRPNHAVAAIEPCDGGFRIRGPWGEIAAGKVVLAAGLGNARLAPMVGLDAPVKPSKGQIIVTEKTTPFLHHPMGTIRQTDEGGVMIGDSQEDRGFDTIVGQPVISVMAERAVRTFPRLAGLNVVRTWSALRVMSPDGFPIYDQSQSHPGAFVVTCHSGVTLAANHVLTLAPAILAGELPEMVASFSARRFHVPVHA